LDEATAQFCSDLEQFAEAVAFFSNLDQDSVLADVETAMGAVEASWNSLRVSANALDSAQQAAMQNVTNDLREVVESIPQEATLGESAAIVKAAALDTLAI
jgi:hypothetical protein